MGRKSPWAGAVELEQSYFWARRSKPFVWSSPCLIHSRRGEERGSHRASTSLPPPRQPLYSPGHSPGGLSPAAGSSESSGGKGGHSSPSISLSPVQTMSCAQGEGWGGAWGGQLRPCWPWRLYPQAWVLVSTGLRVPGTPRVCSRAPRGHTGVGRQTLRLSCVSFFSEEHHSKGKPSPPLLHPRK